MDRRAKLRTLCEKRWASRADALYTFRAAFTVVVQALEILSQDGDGKERGYLCSIKQFDFIIALCAAKHVLSNTVALSTMLQEKSVDFIEAAQEARVVINMKVQRGDLSVWKKVYERGNRLQLSLTLVQDDVCGVNERSDPQERVGQRRCCGGKQSGWICWRTTSNSG